MQLPRVSEAPHRFGGTEFQLEGVEFMHSHGRTWLDIRLSKDDQASVLNTGEALPHRFAPQAGWVSLSISNTSDLVVAKKIIQLAYENARKNLDEINKRRARSPTSN
jgi:hypothetical protein